MRVLPSFRYSLHLSPFEGRPQLTLAGDVDLVSAPQFRDLVDVLIDRAVGDIVLDMSEVRYVDSSALAVLIEAVERLEPEGRRATLLDPSFAVTRLLALCDVTNRFVIVGRTATSEAESILLGSEPTQAAPFPPDVLPPNPRMR